MMTKHSVFVTVGKFSTYNQCKAHSRLLSLLLPVARSNSLLLISYLVKLSNLKKGKVVCQRNKLDYDVALR